MAEAPGTVNSELGGQTYRRCWWVPTAAMTPGLVVVVTNRAVVVWSGKSTGEVAANIYPSWSVLAVVMAPGPGVVVRKGATCR